MKIKTIKNLLLLTGVVWSTGCTGVILDIADALDPNYLEEGWAYKGYLRRMIQSSKKELISEEEKVKAAKAICALKHLKSENRNNEQLIEYAKPFCTLEEGDKIYFYDWCLKCGGGDGMRATSYLLVRKEKPIAGIEIDMKYSRELGRTIPIVDKLH
jgi:hypothetical protein